MKRIIDSKESAVEYIQTILTDWSNWQTHHTNLVQALQILLNDNKELTEENERLRAENAQIIKEAVFSPMERAHNTLAVRADTVKKMLRGRFLRTLKRACRLWTLRAVMCTMSFEQRTISITKRNTRKGRRTNERG